MSLQVISFASNEPGENLAHEEALLVGARAGDDATLCFYVSKPCIVMGRNNREQEWVHTDAVRDAGIPLLRRVSGGGTVYHDPGTLNYGIVLGRKRYDAIKPPRVHIVDFFRRLVISALAPAGIILQLAGKSDLNLNGRKVGGCAAAIQKSGVLFHGTLLFTVDYQAYERFLPIPPNREPTLSHRRFVTSFADEDVRLTMEEAKGMLAEGIGGLGLGVSGQLSE